MKVAFVASLFIGNNTAQSMPYILPMVRNISKMHGMQNGWDLFLHTDAVTKDVVEEVCKAEEIPTDRVNFVLHRRNSGMRGMFWRYAAFFMDELGYDISVVLEGDKQIDSYASDVEVFSGTNHQMMLFDVRQMAVNNNCIDGGTILIRPGIVEPEAKAKLRPVMDLMDHVDDIDYGIDENILLMWLKKNFKNSDVMIVVDDNHNIFQHIENVEAEKEVVAENFPGATIVTIQDLWSLRKDHEAEAIPAVKLNNLHGKKYRLDGTDIELGGWWRAPKSEFCHSVFLEIVEKII